MSFPKEDTLPKGNQFSTNGSGFLRYRRGSSAPMCEFVHRSEVTFCCHNFMLPVTKTQVTVAQTHKGLFFRHNESLRRQLLQLDLQQQKQNLGWHFWIFLAFPSWSQYGSHVSKFPSFTHPSKGGRSGGQMTQCFLPVHLSLTIGGNSLPRSYLRLSIVSFLATLEDLGQCYLDFLVSTVRVGH